MGGRADPHGSHGRGKGIHEEARQGLQVPVGQGDGEEDRGDGGRYHHPTLHREPALRRQQPVPEDQDLRHTGIHRREIDYLPLNGAKSTQTFTEIKNLNDSVETASVGKITKIELTADRKVVNPWLCNGFEAQVGHGNMWIKFAPKDKKVGKGGFWLGGGKHDVLYGLEHKKTWTLYPAGH